MGSKQGPVSEHVTCQLPSINDIYRCPNGCRRCRWEMASSCSLLRWRYDTLGLPVGPTHLRCCDPSTRNTCCCCGLRAAGSGGPPVCDAADRGWGWGGRHAPVGTPQQASLRFLLLLSRGHHSLGRTQFLSRGRR